MSATTAARTTPSARRPRRPSSRRQGTKPHQFREADRSGDFIPTPRDHAYLAAVVELLDAGRPVSSRNLGAVLGLAHTTVLKYQWNRPQAMRWVSAELDAVAGAMRGLVLRRLAEVALRGSVDHARLFLQASGTLVEKKAVELSWADLLDDDPPETGGLE